MSPENLAHKEYTITAALVILAAGLMALLLLKTPATPMRYLLLATPYVFLCSIWLTFRRFYTTSLDKSRQSDPQGFQRLRSSIQMQTVMGAAGIAIALAAGFSLGRLGMH